MASMVMVPGMTDAGVFHRYRGGFPQITQRPEYAICPNYFNHLHAIDNVEV